MTPPVPLLSLSQLAQLAEAAQLAVETVRYTEELHAERWQLATKRRAAVASLEAAQLRETLLFEVGAAEVGRKEAAQLVASLDLAIAKVDGQLAHVEPRVHHSAMLLSAALSPMTGASAACRLPCYTPSDAHV
jgi:hypothetical protein